MKKIIACWFLLLMAGYTFACSTFLLSKDGQLVFGRNYDWVSGNGMVVVNARGVEKTSFVKEGEKKVTWVSKCGSITFNQFGKEFPHGGMNEKGLVVELMWLEGTQYPESDDRGAMNELQWIQYQLDNFSTVEEVIASNEAIRISQNNAAPLHYLVADAGGRAATIEFIDGKMVAHRGKELAYPVLTNTTYAEALQQVKTGGEKTTFGDNSVDRFATACRMVQQFQETDTKQDAVEYAFRVLDAVAQGDFTKWRIVYDITKGEISFLTKGKRKQVSLRSFDFSCGKTPLYLDINSTEQGNVAARFTALSYEQNRKVLQQSAEESKTHVTVSEESVNGGSDYYRQVKCKE